MSTRALIKDVVIAGGGVMGMSTAFNLTKYIDPARICILEPDPTYVRSASALSWASIRQQFSLMENIKLSQSSIKFIRNINQHLGTSEEDIVDINFKEGSYLFLTRKETAHLLEENIAVQLKSGVAVNRYTQGALKAKYPYMNCEDIALAADCDKDEGWFDPWLLLSAYKNKIKDLGVEIRKAEVQAFSPGNAVKVQEGGEDLTIHYKNFVNATGIHASSTNELLNNSLSRDQRFALPVTPLMRQTFNIACKEAPDNVPLICCPLRTTIRSEGTNYIVLGPHFNNDLNDNNEELRDFGLVDDGRFVEEIWENLAYRFPAFEATKILGGWVGYYEYNTLDQNALIGKHPLIEDHYNINGFSGHGIQQSPAAGQCLADMICHVEPHLDIRALSLQRVIDNKPYTERNII